ncbi:energy transducer TonB [Pseudodesulfovibrio thermohalotolerans]|uniref:energy transducer TonB family protein n=1 Tax=Pseudodesulfovibrio thermohalotolerans TaxID=2880651 RepID=UPI0024418476|nr:energy transducer TonB [Pseudodesulfovibrio thermohalotolerans]WFS63077.1 energy transducer TonB [Pseudodesulfovibrio thermohalotolerans]
MNARQLIWTCLAISLGLHWFLLQFHWSRPPAEAAETIIIPANFDLSVASPSNGLALEQGSVPEEGDEKHEKAAERLRRQALKRFLAQVRNAVDRRRFLPGNDVSDLIGNVRYRFRIQPDDTFTDIAMEHSSGSPELDAAARRAIESASGTVKRPAILKGPSWTIAITVKYQYAL